jgi:predicted AlkP superfamily phosphohydrolase/phosphomutase
MLKTRKRVIGIFVIVVALFGAGLIFQRFSGGSIVRNTSNFHGRVIIIGMDGMNPKLVEPMMAEGKLPNFAKLKANGFYSRMSTSNPSQSPVAWTCFSTGRNPGKTGMFDFIKRDPKNYGLSLSTSDIEGGVAKPVVTQERFWQYASEKGVPCTVVAFPITFPPDKDLNGRMLSGMGVPDILGTEGTFSFFTSDPLPESKDTGGKVFHVDNNQTMTMNLVGPLRKAAGRTENVQVPFTVTIGNDEKSAKIELQGSTFELKQGEWSGWKEVSFTMGLFKKIKGILKMYLVEASPGFKLYVSPINMDPRAPAMPISFPESYAKDLAEDPSVGLYHTQGMPCDTWAVNEKRLDEKAFLEHIGDIFNEKKRALDLELKNTPEGILYCYFETPDMTQHMFWRYDDPKSPLPPEDKAGPYQNTIEDCFIKMDGLLGDVMSKMKPTDTLIVMSDHGFASFRRAAHVNAWLREHGYMQLTDPKAKPEDRDLLADVDWPHTKAYAIGFGSIYLNIRGRERDGIVEPGGEAEALEKEIQSKLPDWTDPNDGEKVVKQVYLSRDIFHGDLSKTGPDMYIGFNDGFRASWQTALGNCPDVTIEDNLKKWSGDHLVDPSIVPAILFCNKKLPAQNPSIYDLAPTVLKMVGYTDEELKKIDFDGKPLL